MSSSTQKAAAMSREVRGAAQWLKDEGCDVIVVGDETVNYDISGWSRTVKEVGSKLLLWSVKPHSTVTLPFSLTKSLVQRGSELQVNGKRLNQALTHYCGDHGGVVGVKLGKLTGGNTRLICLVPGDGLTPDGIHGMLSCWLNGAAALQKVGHSPGQSYGEFAIGLSVLGVAGFRFQQPVEIYPQFLYNNHDNFKAHAEALLDESVHERLPKIRRPDEYLLRKAPVFLQASFLHIPTGEMAALIDAHETRTRWVMYKKPKLVRGVFTVRNRERLLQKMR